MAFPFEHMSDEQLHNNISNSLPHGQVLSVEFERRQTEKQIKLSQQALELADKQKQTSENLNTQTNRLIEETIQLRSIAEIQVRLAHRLDRFTKWLVALTVALVFLTVAVLVITVYLYKDAHAQIQRESATSPHKAENP